MLMEVKKHIKLVFLCFKYNLIKAMDNKLSFVGQVIGMILNNAIMIIQWIVFFSLKDSIGGYSFKDVFLLWALASTTYGVAHAFFYNTFSLSRLIMTGKLDAFLIQPKDTLLYVSSSAMDVSAIGDLLYGYIILLILGSSLSTYLLFTLFAITGGIIISCFSILVNSLSFWFTNSEDIANMANATMINVATYPIGIFNDKIRLLFLTFIPVSAVVFVPHSLIKVFNTYNFLYVILFTIGIVLLAYYVFNLGLKKYTSSNLMSARI